MSWNEYVEKSLVGTGTVTSAAILGHDGSVWAASPGFGPKDGEAAALKNGFSDSTSVLSSGIHFNGVKYMTIRADSRSIYGKKGATGVIAVITKQAIIVAYHDDSIQPGQCTLTAEKLADYLINSNY